MKDRILNIVSKTAWILPIAAILTVGACKKTGYLGFTPGTGAPTITSVHTLTKVDTVNTNDTIIAYNSSGDTTQTIRTTQTTTTAFDSATTAGNLGAYYVIEGSNLGSATTVTFNGAVAYFNRALSTDNSIIVSVPSSTPYIGPQATDSLVVVTTHGRVGYKFTILPPAPTVSSYSDFDFSSTGNFQMTLKGVGFAAVTGVTLQGTLSGSSSVNFVSQSDTVMTLTFPPTTVTRGTLAFAYNSGGTTLTALGNQELVDVDNAYQVFAGGAIAPGWGSWSYDQVEVSNTQAITAATSYQMQFSSNGYKVDGLRYESGTAAVGVTYSPNYTYLVFYVYGGVQTETLYVEFGGGASGGFGNGGGNAINAETIKPNQWNYFKIPITSLLWNTTATNWAANSSQLLNTVGFFMKSNGNVTEQLYFDDIVLVQ
jgi:hypothetical protein